MEAAMQIEVMIEEGLVFPLDPAWLQGVIEKTLAAEGLAPNVEISLLVTEQERIRELNREYRGLDQPTDVLSFSFAEQKAGTESEAFIGPPDGLVHLGEVVISLPQAEKQAGEAGHSLRREMAILAIHGILHILGYDHELSEKAAGEMQARQDGILASLGKEAE
jgi:probable rRNA maturation factor